MPNRVVQTHALVHDSYPDTEYCTQSWNNVSAQKLLALSNSQCQSPMWLTSRVEVFQVLAHADIGPIKLQGWHSQSVQCFPYIYLFAAAHHNINFDCHILIFYFFLLFKMGKILFHCGAARSALIRQAPPCPALSISLTNTLTTDPLLYASKLWCLISLKTHLHRTVRASSWGSISDPRAQMQSREFRAVQLLNTRSLVKLTFEIEAGLDWRWGWNRQRLMVTFTPHPISYHHK